MLFGDKETFGIEAMLEPGLKPPSAVWGRMRIWCQGISIGDYSEPHCGLFPAYENFKGLDLVLPQLWRPEFESLSDHALWNLLDGLLYGYHGDVELDDSRSLEQCQADANDFQDFDFLTNWGEQFDRGGKSFIFCPDGQLVRVLNRHLPKQHGLSLQAPVQAVQGAIAAFGSWFEEQASVLRGEA